MNHNANAEGMGYGYVETTAAMTSALALAGKALAGYSDPHAPALPFPCLLTVFVSKKLRSS